MNQKDFELKRNFYLNEGYVVFENIVSAAEVSTYIAIYDDFLSGNIDVGENRSDLGKSDNPSENKKENITQIMWPSDFVPYVVNMPFHTKALQIAQEMLGDDMALDFDMLINKSPYTNTITPWHQDAAYWINLPDTRAISCWMALDEATLDNGCMWYTPKSHLAPLRPHRFANAKGGALACEGSETESVYVPLKPGSFVMHDGKTLHYSRGNSTQNHRRAWILNFRPQAMIDLERAHGFDHGRGGKASDRKIRNNG